MDEDFVVVDRWIYRIAFAGLLAFTIIALLQGWYLLVVVWFAWLGVVWLTTRGRNPRA